MNGFSIDVATGHAKAENDQVVIGRAHVNAIDVEQNEHGKNPDAFVAIDERMVRDETEREPGGLGLKFREELLPAKCRIGGPKGCIEHSLVSDTGQTAGLGQQLSMQEQNLVMCEASHLASSSKAARCWAISRRPAATTSESSAASVVPVVSSCL